LQKNALIKKIKEKTAGLTQQEIKRFMNAFSSAVANSLSADQKVTISGLGTFEIRQRKKKSIINPNNPFERIVLPERKVVKYLAGKTIKDDVRGLVAGSKAKTKDDQKQEDQKPKQKKEKLSVFKKIFSPLKQRKYQIKPSPQDSEVKRDSIKKEAAKHPLEPEDKKSIDELVEEIADEVEKKETKKSIPKAKQPEAEKAEKTEPAVPLVEQKIVKKQIPQPKEIPIKPGMIQSTEPTKPKPSQIQTSKTPPKPTLTAPPPPSKPAPSPAKTTPPKPILKQIETPRSKGIMRGKPFSDIQKKRKFVKKTSPIPKTEINKKLPKGVKIPYINLSKKTIPKETLAKIPEYIARLYQAVPYDIDETNKKLAVAMVDPEDYQAIEFIKKKTGYQIEPRLATAADIGRVLDQYSGIESEVESAIKGTEFAGAVKEAAATSEKPEEKKEELTSEAPTSRVVQSLLRRAVSSKASDIHIEPEEEDIVVRFRIDGVLHKIITLPKKIQASIVSRIKILSGMKIDETRLPQDGRFEQKIHNRDIDFRVSTFPSVNGEKIVMRILDKSTGILSLDELGLTGESFKRLDKSIHESHGMSLVTGPTGSGKTTTLYAVIDRIMNVGINIVTLEDPVEYQIKGINQGQVRADIDFTFAKGLRSIVRQDPDVIMVGEIRDLETAEMAVHAALTGHIVLSTLHTNDAAGAIPRLIDMGVEPFLLTSSLSTVVGQRLARKICEQCKTEDNISEKMLEEIKKEIEKMPEEEAKKYQNKTLKFYKGKGCQSCNKSGYKGRIGIFEVLSMTPGIQELTLKKTSADILAKKAIEEGMITMKQDGIIKALSGKTSIEEVWRVTKE